MRLAFREGHSIMDFNRRHLMGVSAAGVAGALAISPDAARAAPLASALGRDATQYGVRPGSPDDQPKALQAAIEEAAPAVVSFDALGLIVSRNTITGTNDNGIEILRTAIGDDGTLVADNRIEDIKAGPGGSGQYGNAINAFRAGNVIVRGNRIRNCDYSAVRGNSASNIQISGNSVSNVREVPLYSEFSFEGAVIANNTVDRAALGVSVCK